MANSGEKTVPKETSTKTEIVVPVDQQRGVIESSPIEQTTASDVLRVPGRVTLADNGTWRVGAITSGRIERVLVTQGDFVHEGQVLARMHSHDVHEAKAEYLTAQGERSRLEAAAALAQKNYERMQRLYALKAASLEQTEVARQQAMDAQTALRSGQIAVERERAHLEENLGISADAGGNPKNKVPDLIPIRAPASGYVLEKKTTPGSVVEPSTDLFVIGELQRLWMLASVNEADWPRLKLGQSATITVNGLADRTAAGKITDLGQQLDPLTHVLRVRIEFDNSKAKLRPEMLGEAQIAANTSKQALAVRADFDPADSGAGRYFRANLAGPLRDAAGTHRRTPRESDHHFGGSPPRRPGRDQGQLHFEIRDAEILDGERVMLNRIVDFTLENRWMVMAGVIGLVLAGGWALFTIPVDAFPDLTNNQVAVVTEAPSMPPSEVERLVTYPIEVALLGLPKQIEVRSLSKLGLSMVTVVFEDSVRHSRPGNS